MLKKYKVFLIEKGKDTVGSLAYEQKNADNVYIADIAIKPAFQRQGIGREVLKNLLQKFKDVKRIDLLTHPENKALKLYESLGFVTESVEENYYGDGEPRLVLALEKK
jgi:ribosomal-protein-alanine N-acetyltransferase